mmetsp:Transcript_39846/g.83576  ORF Transcript_39846/g.83576 Transcript_39846/m.83576 type:complete len:215 (-) Transcript_39846:379-1023(-)
MQATRPTASCSSWTRCSRRLRPSSTRCCRCSTSASSTTAPRRCLRRCDRPSRRRTRVPKATSSMLCTTASYSAASSIHSPTTASSPCCSAMTAATAAAMVAMAMMVATATAWPERVGALRRCALCAMPLTVCKRCHTRSRSLATRRCSCATRARRFERAFPTPAASRSPIGVCAAVRSCCESARPPTAGEPSLSPTAWRCYHTASGSTLPTPTP